MVVNCETIWSEISNYIDDEVDPSLRAAIDEHIPTCPRCASVLAGARNVVQLYGDERMLEIPAGFSRRLEKRLARDSRLGWRPWSSWSVWLIPVAALALFAGGLKLTSSFTFRHPVKSILAAPAAKDIPPDLQVVVSNGSRLFHVPGCAYIHDKASERALTAKQAIQQGYSPCPRCLRQYLKTKLNRHASQVVEAENSDPHELNNEVLNNDEGLNVEGTQDHSLKHRQPQNEEDQPEEILIVPGH